MSAAPQAGKKAKPDLSTVTVAPPPPEPELIDTTTPVDTSVLPFTMIYMNKWGPWLLSRLQEHWDYISPLNFRGIVSGLTTQNGCIFIRAKRAILLAVASRDTLELRPVVKVVFCFKFHPEDDDETKDVRLLLRRVEEWAKTIGARYVRMENIAAIDLSPSRAKDALFGKDATYLVKDLDA